MANCCILNGLLIATISILFVVSAAISTLFVVSTLPLLNSNASSNLIGDILKQSSSLIHSDSSLSVIVIDMIDLGSETVDVFKSSFMPKIINEPLKPAFTYQMKGLPIQNYSNYPINYLGGDEPLYLLEGSVLNYSLEIIHDNSINCSVCLQVFDDICEYQKFLRHNYSGPLMCITESTYHPVSFVIKKSSSYFVAIQIAANVAVNSTIFVDYVYYNTTGLNRPDDCNNTLTSVNSKCEVTVCNSYLSCTSDYYILVEPSGVVNMSVTRIQRFLLNGKARIALFIIIIPLCVTFLLTLTIMAKHCLCKAFKSNDIEIIMKEVNIDLFILIHC